MENEPESRGCRPPARVLLKGGFFRVALQFFPGKVLSGVTDPNGRSQYEGNAEFFRQVHGKACHEPGFFGGCRIQDGDFGKARHESGILLGLGRMGSRIITGNDDQASDGSHIDGAHKCVGCHVEPYLLHAAGGSFSGNGCGKGIVQGHFFVGGPFHISIQTFRFYQTDDFRQYLGTGGSRIGGHHLAAGLHQSQGNGAVS